MIATRPDQTQMLVQMQDMRLCVLGVIQRTIREVGGKRAAMFGETGEGILQALQRPGQSGRLNQAGGARNRFIERMTHGAAQVEHGKCRRSKTLPKPSWLELRITLE